MCAISKRIISKRANALIDIGFSLRKEGLSHGIITTEDNDNNKSSGKSLIQVSRTRPKKKEANRLARYNRKVLQLLSLI
jgi:hypothetical protein